MLAIKGGQILTMSAMRPNIPRGCVVVDGEDIIEVGKEEELWPKYSGHVDEVIDSQGKIVLPGLVNAHTHVTQILLRGLADDLPLLEWGQSIVWPLIRTLTQEDCYTAALLCSAEMIMTGTTCCAESFYAGDQQGIYGIAKGMEESGLRIVIGRSFRDSPPAPSFMWETPDEARKSCIALIRSLNGKANGRVRVCPFAATEDMCSLELITTLREVSREYKTGFHMHLGETAKGIENFVKKRGIHPIEFLEKQGVLGPDVLLAHCVWLSDKEIDIVARTRTNVAHNPISNQFLGSGIAPVPDMLRKGVTVGLGTDGAVSNNSQDMFEVMKSCALLHKVNSLNPAAINAQKVLSMATIEGARALGLDKYVGSIEVGKKADLIILNPELYALQPLYNTLSNMVYCSAGKAVDTTVVGGRVLMQNGKLLTLASDVVIERTRRAADRIGRSFEQLVKEKGKTRV